MLFGFFISEAFYHIPASFIIAFAGALLFLVSLRYRVFSVYNLVMRETPWKVVVFSIGMYVVVYGLRNAGLTYQLSRLLELAAGEDNWVGVFTTGFLSAFLSSVMNNMPSVMIVNLAIDETGLSTEMKKILGYANVVGCDLGPKITPIGSLATLLWLYVLEYKGIKISWGYYFKTGIILTLPTLAFTLLGLYLVVKLFS